MRVSSAQDKRTDISMPIQRNEAALIKRSGPFPLILAKLLTDRRIAAVLSATAVFIIVLKMAGLGGWHCPFNTAFGQPCPGCGLTRALAALMGGNWQTALQTHPLAPFAAAAMLLLTAVAVLPAAAGQRITAAVAMVESHSGMCWLVIVAAIGHWVGRLSGYW
jgi:hypothetical protein